jgi:hypothetical protein
MESQMLGLRPFFTPKLALIVVAGLSLSVATTAAYADSARPKTVVKGAHVTSHATTQVPEPATTGSIKPSNHCVGGYTWTQRSFNVHRTENQMALPLPCR